MTDFHHNIFYYYRGAQRSNRERERQLEDNTTKALINTLEHCSPTVVLKFLDWLGITAAGPAKFELQKASIGTGKIWGRSQRLLLGLVPSKGASDPCDELDGTAVATKEDSRPDAWLYGDDFIVLLESKVAGSLELDQMQRHYQKLRVGMEGQPRCEVRTWAEVHQFFVGILPELCGKDKWIVEQFTQYLEGIGMAEFAGLEQEIFDYFITHDDEEERQRVRGIVQSFAEKILDGLQAFDSSFYQSYDVGQLQLKDKYCWVAFGPEGEEYRQWAHQTVSLGAYGLDVFVNVELKHATDKLKARICRDKQGFREKVKSLLLDEPFSVQVEERKKIRASLYDYHRIARLEADYLRDPKLGLHGFNYIEELLKQIHLPYLSVRRRIDRNRALELSRGDGRSLVDEVVGVMKAFHPLVKFINEPDYTNTIR